MNSNTSKTSTLLNAFLEGEGIKPLADIGAADRDVEAAYRRGYHQAIAEAMVTLKAGKSLSAESLSKWVEEDGMQWRKNMDLERKIIPPSLS